MTKATTGGKIALATDGAGQYTDYVYKHQFSRIMLDFTDKIEVHYPGTDGVTIFAYGENSEYDFITILPGEEYLVSRQISHQREGLSNHLIVVLQDREQIKKVDIPEVSAFCVVAEDGSTEYLSYRKGESYDSN